MADIQDSVHSNGATADATPTPASALTLTPTPTPTPLPTPKMLLNASSLSLSIGSTPSLQGGSGVLFILKDSEIVRLFSQVPKETILNCLKSVGPLYHLTLDETIEKVPKLKLLHVVNECICFTGIDDFTGCLQAASYPALISLLGSPDSLTNHPFLHVDPSVTDEHRLSFYQQLSSHIKRKGINWLLDNADEQLKQQFYQSLRLDIIESATEPTTTTTTTTTTEQIQQANMNNKIKDEIILRGTESFLKNVKAPVIRSLAEGLKINKLGSKELLIDKIMETIFNLKLPPGEIMEDRSPDLELPNISITPHSTPEIDHEVEHEDDEPLSPVRPVPPPPSTPKQTKRSTAAAPNSATKIKIPIKNITPPTPTTTPTKTTRQQLQQQKQQELQQKQQQELQQKQQELQQKQQELQQKQQELLQKQLQQKQQKQQQQLQQKQQKQQKQQQLQLQLQQQQEEQVVEETPELNAFGRVKRKQKLNTKYFDDDFHEEKAKPVKEVVIPKKIVAPAKVEEEEEEEEESEESVNVDETDDEKSSSESSSEEEESEESSDSEKDESNSEESSDSEDNSGESEENSDESDGSEEDSKVEVTPKKKRKATEPTLNPLSLIVKGITREQLHTLFHAPDLRIYCRLNSLRSTGSKRDIMRRILLYLKKGVATPSIKSQAALREEAAAQPKLSTTPSKKRRRRKVY